MTMLAEIRKSLVTAVWFMFLTFPILVIRVNTVEKVVQWRWMNLLYVGVGAFLLSALWRYMIGKRERGERIPLSVPAALVFTAATAFTYAMRRQSGAGGGLPWAFLVEAVAFAAFLAWWLRVGRKRTEGEGLGLVREFRRSRTGSRLSRILLAFAVAAFPWVFYFQSPYQTNIVINALIYVMLGLGLNIVVGLAGLLDLGYVAFYAVGAYTYALLNTHYHLGFWQVLPLGGLVGACFGVLLGFPVLRLRGDYLAIVTLGFGEIIRLILENWNTFSHGPSGISGIQRPGFLGIPMTMAQSAVFIYYVMVLLTGFTIFVVNRLQNSRIGRAWVALREDETACQAMGIDKTRIKLAAFALGATWASMGGVVFAAKTTFINPQCFTFMESVIILVIVVLGGMGSIPGVVIGALVVKLGQEYLRAFAQYWQLAFGVALVIMMIFRPQGLIPDVRRRYEYPHPDGGRS